MDPDPTLLLIHPLLHLSFFINLAILIVLLLCSALISGAEVALFSLTKSDMQLRLDLQSKSMATIEKLLQKPKKLLATILVANNFINIAIVLLFAFLGETLFNTITTPWVRFFTEVVSATVLILLFGEIIPKIYASRNHVEFSEFMAKPLHVLYVICSPLSGPMRYVTLKIHNTFGKQKSNLSVDQLSQALELTDTNETSTDEQKILKGIVSFGNTDTKQVMRPRMDIFALPIKASFQRVVDEIINNGYSRIPVYKDNMDSIVGVLYVKDVLPHLKMNNFKWTSLLRDPFFVPENKKLDDLMVEFQTKKVHLAIVVDEYGGTSGIVSLEDIIEEIVGDISDEYDDDDISYTKMDANTFYFEGKTPLKDIYRIAQITDSDAFEDKKGEAETIAGFILELTGGFPKRHSTIEFNNCVFTIDKLEKKRIKNIKLHIKR